ncbi:MAG: SDR family oxidoreductase, partial [Janthinobacterium lividum]
LTREALSPDAPSNLFETVAGRQQAHGRFDSRSRTSSRELFSSRHKTVVATAGALGLIGLALLQRAAGRLDGRT